VTFLGKPSSVEGLPSEAFIAREMAKIPGLPWMIKGDLGSLEAQSWLSDQSGVLVVAPSLVDNLPYAVIELFSRRIPFVSTRIGGIPEIVGASNQHMLADPTEASLATVIGRVYAQGSVAVDYGDGYNVAVANDTHVAFVQELLATPPEVQPQHRGVFDVVVVGASDELALARTRLRVGEADRDLMRGQWMGVDDWRARRTETPALFMHADVMPAAGCALTLLNAVAQPGVAMATSYFTLDDSAGPFDTGRVVAPLGGALEAGWRRNVFGGPCFAAAPAAFEALRSMRASFEFWPGYAAVVCRGLTLAVVPASLYHAGPATRQARTHAELESVLSEFHSSRPSDLDLGWLLKAALGTGPTTDVGRALYDRFVTMPDELIGAYAGLTADDAQNPFIRDFATVRQTLSAAVTRWRETDPRVWIYGTGQHAKMMLSVCPELGAFVAGFIDRRSMGRFLGKPCVTPDAFNGAEADAIVYSSREFEHEMYARMKDTSVEHVLLYRESPTEPEVNTTTRLRRRFGHAGADLSALRAMYQVPKWATGYVSTSDAAFLAEIIAAVEPRTVVEIGVASGASSAAILHSLDRLREPEQRTLYSCDVRPTCYFNEAFETGQACREMYPHPRALWQRDWTMDARRLRAQVPAGSVDLTFIDANHAHPWPLLDLLHATEFAKPGSWVVLHDVELPIQHPAYQIYGPRWLFQAWPFNKVKGIGPWTSIGAVQLPDDPSELASMAISLIEKPWEHTPAEPHLRLPACLADVQEAFSVRLRRASGALVA
jgi:predicted O-methyltransferase YrrM